MLITIYITDHTKQALLAACYILILYQKSAKNVEYISLFLHKAHATVRLAMTVTADMNISHCVSTFNFLLQTELPYLRICTLHAYLKTTRSGPHFVDNVWCFLDSGTPVMIYGHKKLQ
jgi:hypothetical protein